MSYITWIRSQVGHRKIFLAFSSVVLRDDAGRVLLQRRTDFDVWGLPGGILEPGESIVDCAHRELLEETGLTAGPLSLVGVYTDPCYDSVYPNGDQVQQYTVCMQARCTGGEMRPDGVETSAQRFFAPDEIPYDQMPHFYQDMVRDALAGGRTAFKPPYSNPDAFDQVLYMRRFIGQEPFVGVGAAAVIRDAQGRVLLGLRSDDGYWDFPGGFSHLGENAARTAQREAQEETGLEVVPERVLGVFSPPELWEYPNGDRVYGLVTYFACRVVGGELHPDGGETLRLAWFDPRQEPAPRVHPFMRRMFQALVESLDGHVFLV